ncbi:LytR/AlgR family response regulator transcription factor [Salibacter halophilus]|uniref:Response regulator transcription factor n=1 Tax=Salibacter halophilus TaxID=1803916 RepID=A0A6N6MAR1_9FLAO|nr:response regulator transcription factor [Salibacter halophilus]KAB1065521.1 response regulator transcription factor [Salibacter halophilus]
MQNVRLLIVEDDLLQSEKIENMAEDLGYEVVQVINNASEAINVINAVQPDVLVMDINLDDELDGIEIVKKAKPETDFALIYVTSLADYQTLERSQATDPDSYLIKPVSEPQFKSAVELAVSKRGQNLKLMSENGSDQKHNFGGVLNETIFVKVGDSLKKIPFSDILYFQASKDKYCDIATVEKSITARITLSELSELLPEKNFMRIHRSTVINLEHLEYVNKDHAILGENIKVPVGRTYKRDLYSRMRIVG